ncbi:uncharacterized protein LAJ45_05819 [Morchella importuna]|uniref:uncharacterized protein n=1 Tax=Morchella importuna TaxID=1174673 RepID=UPI001E8CCCA8|nr:uncharacterized protein LAJ45_05819 [Morchella importuna]KAH8150133.1 hypothetical protein LAJ45_05819 [Morchella importuna]
MQFKSILASSVLAVAAVSAQTTTGFPANYLGSAAVINDNPVGTTYSATFEGNVTGKMTFTASTNGTGVAVKVDLLGFSGATGPFNYHVHDQPVPADGNCNGTLAHLDPYQRGQTPACDKTAPETCEVGDMSGKHNAVPNTNGSLVEFHDAYVDNFISTKSGIAAFIGNRSIVIHKAGGGRYMCVNITLDTSASNTSTPVFQNDESAASSFGVSSALALGGMLVAAVFAL